MQLAKADTRRRGAEGGERTAADEGVVWRGWVLSWAGGGRRASWETFLERHSNGGADEDNGGDGGGKESIAARAGPRLGSRNGFGSPGGRRQKTGLLKAKKKAAARADERQRRLQRRQRPDHEEGRRNRSGRSGLPGGCIMPGSSGTKATSTHVSSTYCAARSTPAWRLTKRSSGTIYARFGSPRDTL
jgi:hypothetical protein